MVLCCGFHAFWQPVAEFDSHLIRGESEANPQPSRCQIGCQPPIGDKLTSTTRDSVHRIETL